MPQPFQDELDEDREDGEDDLSPEELREQLAAERAARASERESRESTERRFDALLQGSRQTVRPEVKPLGLCPNPSDDPDGFRTWMAEDRARSQRELDARLERSSTEVREAVSQESRAQILWERFRSKYPVYAERESLVEVAYQRLASAGKLPGGNEAAVDAVKREMDSLAGLPLDRTANRTDDASRLGRSPASRRGRRESAEDKIVSTSDAILDRQIAAGLR